MSSKVTLFILISLLAHIIVLVTFSDNNESITLTQQGHHGLAIVITPNTNTVLQQKNPVRHSLNTTQTDSRDIKSATNNSSDINSHKTSVKIPDTVKTIKVEPAEQNDNSENSSDKIQNFNEENSNKTSSNQTLTIIEEELSRYFYYPKSALRKNWQGTVVLSFTIQPDGSIKHILIDKSSGYQILDNAAKNALSKVERHQEIALALNGHSLTQTLPVIYKLID